MWLTTTEASANAEGLRPTQRAFIEALIDTGSITEASARIGIDRTSHYDWLHAEGLPGLIADDSLVSRDGTPYGFAFLRAKELAADRILERSEAHARSEATDMPATVNRMFHIKRWYPQYRDQFTVKSTSMQITARVDLNQLDPSERAELLRLTQRRLELAQGENVAGGSDADE